MQTLIHPKLSKKPEIIEAEEILRACVHCGFCNAVCPTYQLLGDELDGPRGRIYQIKNMLQSNELEAESAVHLDRCLSCRSCETTCPSGVQYTRLLDIARDHIEHKPDFFPRFVSSLMRKLVPNRFLFEPLLSLGQLFRPVLPKLISKHVPPKTKHTVYSKNSLDSPKERVLLLKGCVQNAATPNVNNAIEYLLSSLNVEVCYLDQEGCCGALEYHLSAQEDAKQKMKQLIELLYAQLDGLDWIISSASGCGVTLKDFPLILQYDEDIIEKANAVSAKVLDISEYFPNAKRDQDFSFTADKALKVAIHNPCTLQHGQKLPDSIKAIMAPLGVCIVETEQDHLCCGSAGAYSIMQPKISQQLTIRKVSALSKNKPDIILTANIGCQLTLQENTNIKVMHWVEFLAMQKSRDS